MIVKKLQKDKFQEKSLKHDSILWSWNKPSPQSYYPPFEVCDTDARCSCSPSKATSSINKESHLCLRPAGYLLGDSSVKNIDNVMEPHKYLLRSRKKCWHCQFKILMDYCNMKAIYCSFEHREP